MSELERVLDDIDALVDASLEGGEPVGGYDHGDPDFPRCGHCDRAWHGLPLTERVAAMYAEGCYDEDYRVADDDSPVICPGSDFIGPVPLSKWTEKRLRGWLDEFEDALTRVPVVGSRYDFSTTVCHWTISANSQTLLAGCLTHIRHYVLTLGRKNPSPAGDGWYCAIMQRALRPRNSPPLYNSGNALASGTYSPPSGVWPNTRGLEATQCLVDEMPLQIVTSEDIPVGTFYLIPTDDPHPDLSELPGPETS